MNCFKVSAEIVEHYLIRSACNGTYTIVPHEKVRWKPKHGEKMCLRPSQGKAIKLRVRPGNNDSVWEYSLLCGDTVDPGIVRQNLEAALGPEQTDSDHEVVVPTASVKADTPHELMTRVLASIERRQQRQREIEALNANLRKVDTEIADLEKSKDDIYLKIMELQEQDEDDADANAAEKISALLAPFLGDKQ